MIRGTYKGLRNADPIHLVEPGEFILGYPDNRGNIPPGPTLAATLDPANMLPLVSGTVDFSRTVVEDQRDIGFNGSFLVIRELEQDVDGFWDYCGREAARLADRLPQPYVIKDEFIAAKLIGRWTDGSSLMRHPYEPQTSERKRASACDRRELRRDRSEAAGCDPAARATVRPTSKPATAASTPIREPPIRLPDRQRLPVRHRGPGSAPLSLRLAYPPRKPARQPGSWLPGPDRHQQPPPRHPGRAAARAGAGPNGSAVHVPERRHRTPVRVPAAELAQEPVLPRPLLREGSRARRRRGRRLQLHDPDRDGPVRLSPMPRFVTTKGGGYFFLPGKRLVEYLCAPL